MISNKYKYPSDATLVDLFTSNYADRKKNSNFALFEKKKFFLIDFFICLQKLKHKKSNDYK